MADEVSVGYVCMAEAAAYGDGLAVASDDGCGTLADAYFEEKTLGAESTSICSYVGGKPLNCNH